MPANGSLHERQALWFMGERLSQNRHLTTIHDAHCTHLVWNDFLFGVVFGGSDAQPVTVALNNLVNTTTGIQEHNVNMAAAIIAALPTLVIYLIAGKYFVRGLTAGAVKG